MKNKESLTDDKIIQMIKRGLRVEDQAIRYLSVQLKDNMFAHIDRLGRGVVDPMEVWQNSLIVLINSIYSGKYEERFLGQTTIAGFLYGTIRNLCRSELRHQQRFANIDDYENYVAEGFVQEIDMEILNEGLEARLHAQLLRSGLEKGCIELFLQYYYRDMNLDRVAEAMGKSKYAIEKRFQRCRRKAIGLLPKR